MTETEAKWAERVREWKSSGRSADEFAAGRGLNPSTLRWWSSRIGRGQGGARIKSGAGASSHVRMVQVVARSQPAAPVPLFVHLGPTRVEVRAGFDRAALRELVEVFGGQQ